MDFENNSIGLLIKAGGKASVFTGDYFQSHEPLSPSPVDGIVAPPY